MYNRNKWKKGWGHLGSGQVYKGWKILGRFGHLFCGTLGCIGANTVMLALLSLISTRIAGMSRGCREVGSRCA